MFRISCSIYEDFTLNAAAIEMDSSPAHMSILIEYCIFHNMTTSASSHAGAIHLAHFQSEMRYINFIECVCENSEENDAGNAIKVSGDSSNIAHCLIFRCPGDVARGESAISSRDTTYVSIANSNFTKNVAQNSEGHYGSPSVECTSSSANNTMKYSHIEDSKGSRAIYYSYGNVSNTNIIGFSGLKLLGQIDIVNNCCFFNNSVDINFSKVNIIKNCLTDDERFNESTTAFTLWVLSTNALWSTGSRRLTCANQRKCRLCLASLLLIAAI